MTKDQFNLLDIDQQVDYVNNKIIGGESVKNISIDLDLGKNYITSTFKRKGYILDKITKQYLNNLADDRPIIKPIEKIVEKIVKKIDYKPDHRPENKLEFTIPIKSKTKSDTKAFNIVVNKDTVEQLDKLCKSKNYSRNQLINYMINYCIDNLKD